MTILTLIVAMFLTGAVCVRFYAVISRKFVDLWSYVVLAERVLEVLALGYLFKIFF